MDIQNFSILSLNSSGSMTPKTGLTNYLRFQLSPGSAIALAARVKRAGKEFVGEQHELHLIEEASGRGIAVRATPGRCHGRRWNTLHP